MFALATPVSEMRRLDLAEGERRLHVLDQDGNENSARLGFRGLRLHPLLVYGCP